MKKIQTRSARVLMMERQRELVRKIRQIDSKLSKTSIESAVFEKLLNSLNDLMIKHLAISQRLKNLNNRAKANIADQTVKVPYNITNV